MSSDAILIRRMRPDEVSIAVEWARQEGWNPGLHDGICFYQCDPHGFFVGELDGVVVAVGSAVVYDDEFAFCGLYIVSPEHRGKGYGLALTKARLEYCGDRNVGIDGVLENVDIYARIGYEKYYQNARYQFTAGEAPGRHRHVCSIDEVDADILNQYDRQCFPAARKAFLDVWIHQNDALSLAWVEDGKLKGYMVRRRCHDGHKIGPLFADDPSIGEHLLVAGQEGVSGQALFIDIPEINDAALDLARQYDMKLIFATARMYQKGLPDLEYDRVFGITTFELG
ncbi:MAG: GNAT family N-acetyltransferase [Fuerstiella sp.]|nr:GNAT family N-acetyltransferase [Fuerstiella sp.]